MGSGLGDGRVLLTKVLDLKTVAIFTIPSLDNRVATSCSISRRDRAIGKIMISGDAKRPVVKTGIIIGKAAGKMVASFSNGCALSTPINSVLIVSCVNCRSVRIGTITNIRRVQLNRSARTLRRMIMIKCNMRGGTAIAKSMSAMGNDSLGAANAAGVAGAFTNGLPNIITAGHSNRPNGSCSSVLVHNGNSLGSGSPLVIVSKITGHNNLRQLGPDSVRSIGILGSTSTTVCNTRTTGNMVLIAAGQNASSGPAVACGNSFALSNGAHAPSLVGTCRYVA